MASNNNNTQNPFDDSSESGLGQSRYDYSPSHQAPTQDLIDLQQNRSVQSQHQTFSNSTSSSTLNPQQPAYTHQVKRNDSSFAIDEGKREY